VINCVMIVIFPNQPLQKTEDRMQTIKHKRTTKVPKTRSDDFLFGIRKDYIL
jgi:hypothetical protein